MVVTRTRDKPGEDECHMTLHCNHMTIPFSLGPDQRLVVIEPFIHSTIFLLVQIHLDWFQRLHIQHVISIIERGLLIIKGWEPHPLEMPSVSLLSSHHDPHSSTEITNNDNNNNQYYYYYYYYYCCNARTYPH